MIAQMLTESGMRMSSEIRKLQAEVERHRAIAAEALRGLSSMDWARSGCHACPCAATEMLANALTAVPTPKAPGPVKVYR